MNDRRDQHLDLEALKRLLDTDADRFLLEWTFRIPESPAISDDPGSFLEYLCCEFTKRIEGTFRPGTARQLRAITDGYHAGNISLQDWLASTRRILTGEGAERMRVRKDDPELRAAIQHIYPHLLPKRSSSDK